MTANRRACHYIYACGYVAERCFGPTLTLAGSADTDACGFNSVRLLNAREKVFPPLHPPLCDLTRYTGIAMATSDSTVLGVVLLIRHGDRAGEHTSTADPGPNYLD